MVSEPILIPLLDLFLPIFFLSAAKFIGETWHNMVWLFAGLTANFRSPTIIVGCGLAPHRINGLSPFSDHHFQHFSPAPF
jgi:hypothetical protein